MGTVAFGGPCPTRLDHRRRRDRPEKAPAHRSNSERGEKKKDELRRKSKGSGKRIGDGLTLEDPINDGYGRLRGTLPDVTKPSALS